MLHVVGGLTATIVVLAIVFGLIVSPGRVRLIADKIAIGGFALGLGLIVCLVAAMFIGMAVGAAQMLGVVPFLLLCLLLQGRSRHN